MWAVGGAAQREIREEVGSIRTPSALLILCVALGCSSPPKTDQPDKPKPAPEKEEPAKSHTINLGEGSGDKVGGAENREKLWTVKWKSAVMEFYESGKDFSGTLNTVTGTIYKDNETVSTFAGDESKADKSKNVLELEGKVKVISKAPPMTLTCERLRYEADKKLIKALGSVRVVGEGGVISGLEEIWTTPDLKVVATPDAWGKK